MAFLKHSPTGQSNFEAKELPHCLDKTLKTEVCRVNRVAAVARIYNNWVIQNCRPSSNGKLAPKPQLADQ